MTIPQIMPAMASSIAAGKLKDDAFIFHSRG
jgi:hypothetical protein